MIHARIQVGRLSLAAPSGLILPRHDDDQHELLLAKPGHGT
jgi:hypothetical protein